ncbi:hemolysin family protein [Rubrobacter tropicus]|uniref:hemolysin family protein n=1 Tax=Rubrobacter tropicus TaxID=2653851 RepID=UPI001D18FA3B|nr:hemolysin family protein [Rubrobacter tropicus]
MRILAALLLVALNGLFVAAEFAFVRIRATQVDRLVAERKPSAGLVKVAQQKLDQYLAVCQLGITVCSLGIGALAEPAIANLIEPLLETLGIPASLLHPIAIAIALFIASFLHVVFGELAPKTFAIQKAEGTSLFVAPFMRFFYYLLLPFTIVFNGTANAITGALGVAPASEGDDTHSEQEIRQLIAQSTEQGVLERDEESRLRGVFNLENTPAREIMVPRPDVVAIPGHLKLKDLIPVVGAGNYTRYPVHEEHAPDRVIGAVHVKDVLRAVGPEGDVGSDVTARDLAREVIIVPESRSIENILEDFQRQEIQMAVVIDEWGSFEGLITIEDILEEIVGEIRDEFDEEEPDVEKLPDGSHAIDGRAPIPTVNNALGSRFESADFETIGGLVLGALGRAPEVGDEVGIDGHLLRVDEIDGPRVAKVVVTENGGAETNEGF